MTDAIEDQIRKQMFLLLHERGASKTICPSEVARAIAGKNENEWRLLMRPIKAFAVEAANAGEIIIKRKGKMIDPQNIKGIYRIGLSGD